MRICTSAILISRIIAEAIWRMQPVLCITEQSGQVLFKLPESLKLEGLVTLCAPDAVCFSRHIPHASGRILAERFYVIGTLRSNFLLHKKSVSGLSPETDFFIAYFFSDQISVLFASETFFYKNYNCYDCCQKNNHEWKNRCIISCLNCSLSCRI